MINLDHNATTPLAEPVRLAVDAAARDFPGNPSSTHTLGRAARAELERARVRLGRAIGADPAGLVWCSSGSEANNLAIKGVLQIEARRRSAAGLPPPHVVVTGLEHPCVRRALSSAVWHISELKCELIEIGADGRARIDRLLAAIRPETVLVVLQLANHETGVVQPVAELAAALRGLDRGLLPRPLLHCDAVQAPGRLPLDVAALGADLVSVAAHKFGGPRGIAALWTRPGLDLEPLVHGGPQESARRAGTENLPGAVGMALAAELACGAVAQRRAHLMRLEQVFLTTLENEGFRFTLNGRVDERLPGVLNLALPRLGREDLVVGLDVEGVAVSAGSACASGAMEPSPVLLAMGLESWRVDGAIRISFGVENTEGEAAEAARRLAGVAARLQEAQSSYAGEMPA